MSDSAGANGGTQPEHGEVRRPPGFLDRLVIPAHVLADTLSGLALGREREMLAYWIGAALPNDSQGRTRALVTTVAFPRIVSGYDFFQLVPGQMGLITGWCADRDLWVLAQVHSHPTDEPHSQADETWPASTRPGFLSFVVPFFAHFSTLREPGWRVHEAMGGGRWREVDPSERVEILDNVWLPGAAT